MSNPDPTAEADAILDARSAVYAALERFDATSNGDSADAEHDAALALADATRALLALPLPDVVTAAALSELLFGF